VDAITLVRVVAKTLATDVVTLVRAVARTVAQVAAILAVVAVRIPVGKQCIQVHFLCRESELEKSIHFNLKSLRMMYRKHTFRRKWIIFYNMLLTTLALTFYSCDKEEITQETSITIPGGSNLTSPTLDKILTTTDYDGFSIRLRFTNGGDVTDNISCKVHWRAYSSKPSTMPRTSDMNQSEPMRTYASTKTKTTFDKSHAGYKGGTYIYYYAVCKNSKYSCTTPVTFTIVKR